MVAALLHEIALFSTEAGKVYNQTMLPIPYNATFEVHSSRNYDRGAYVAMFWYVKNKKYGNSVFITSSCLKKEEPILGEARESLLHTFWRKRGAI